MSEQHRNKSGFETRAIHAGYEPDPTTGAVIPPIYATSDLQAGRGRRPARRLRVQPLRQPDPHRPRGATSPRSRRGSAASRSPPAWPPRTPWSARCARPGDHVVDPRRRVRRHLPALRQGRAGRGASTHSAGRRSPTSTPSAPRSARARPSWSGSRRRPTRCSTSPTSRRWPASPTTPGALLVVDNTFASPYLQQPLDPRRRRRRALDDEVLRRPLRRRRRRARRARPRARREARASTRTRWARWPGRSTPG